MQGRKIGYLVVESVAKIDKSFGAIWNCRCVCGNVIQVSACRLNHGKPQSCGCMTQQIVEATNLKKYGEIHAMRLKETQDKAYNTNMERYGVGYAGQSEELKTKIRATNIKRYGVDNPTKNRDIALRAAKAVNKTTTLVHWFSGEDIDCTASYEKRTAEYFNNNQIDFNWKVQTFLMPDGRTFTPDCYLPNEDLWIEIKGYFREDAKEKWAWFQKNYPNSELWDKQKLKEMGIIK